MKRTVLLALAGLLVMSLAAFTGCRGDGEFPSRNITMISPWAAGGGTDAVARALASAAERELGVNIIVENRTGGGGAVGHAAIRNARPDGYTVGIFTFEINSIPQQGLIDFTWEDYDPLMLVNAEAAALTVHINAPFNTVQEFVDFARQNPGAITIGNSAPGSVWHIAAGLFADQTGIQVNHVPFEGAAPAVIALAGGHIQAVAVSLGEVRSQLDAGNVKVLGVMDTQRSEMFPDVPTFIEQGFDVVMETWRGLALPRGVDPEIRETLERAFTTAMHSQFFQDQMRNLNLVPTFMAAEPFREFLGENKDAITRTMVSLGMIME